MTRDYASCAETIGAPYSGYLLNSILFDRNLYSKEHFQSVTRHGLSLAVVRSPKIKDYLRTVLDKVTLWASTEQLLRVVLVLLDNGRPLERWSICTVYSRTDPEPHSFYELLTQVQLTARSLPAHSSALTYDVLLITEENTVVPPAWEETAPLSLSPSQKNSFPSYCALNMSLQLQLIIS